MKSRLALIFTFIFIFCVSFFYYPKWQFTRTEATISWDVSGYYMYLPAIFIYKDIKGLKFQEEIRNKYGFTPDFQQAYQHEKSGNYVMKYSAGQALQFLPFFMGGHFAANVFGYPADGFSTPYQLAISFGALFVCFLGLYFIRKILLQYFSDAATAWTLVMLALATNYLNYAAIDGAMTHNFLFTLYAILAYVSDRFYRKPTFLKAAIIGIICGWATLTRPTEIIAFVIPLFWGVYNFPSLRARFQFIQDHFLKYLIAGVFLILVGSIQILYWKYATGDFLVYSYQEQSFSWFKPHLWKGMFSFRSGWLIYSPVMIFSLIGFYWLYKQQRTIFPAILLFSLLFIYLCFAWDIWWYGGSLGIRAMVQAYAVLAFPLAAFIQFVLNSSLKIPVLLLFLIFGAYNLWLTHQAHKGGLLFPGDMTRTYFWKILGKSKETIPEDVYKYLDTDEAYAGTRENVALIYSNNFESDTSSGCSSAIEGNKSFCLNLQKQFSPEFGAALTNKDADYVRAQATFRAPNKEWNTWRMCQFIVKFYNNDQVVKQKSIRVFRLLNDGQTKDIYLDVKLPEKAVNRVTASFWNAESDKEIIIDNLILEKFND